MDNVNTIWSVIVCALAGAVCLIVALRAFAGKGTLLAGDTEGRQNASGVLFICFSVAFFGVSLSLWLPNGWLRLASVGIGVVGGVLYIFMNHRTGKDEAGESD